MTTNLAELRGWLACAAELHPGSYAGTLIDALDSFGPYARTERLCLWCAARLDDDDDVCEACADSGG